MLVIIGLIFGLVVDLFRSRAALGAEILVLRQQIIVLRRSKPARLPFVAADRLVLGWACRLFPTARDALAIVQPETVVRWHRAGFRFYWRWKSRRRAGRPVVSIEVRRLIREMSIENPLWGAPRIHGELLKLGINVGQTSVAKYMARRRGPPSQGWKTFLRNHADTEDFVARRNGASDRRVDRQSTHGSLRLEVHTRLSDPRPRCLLRQSFSFTAFVRLASVIIRHLDARPGRMATRSG
jgi:hypothetical protein